MRAIQANSDPVARRSRRLVRLAGGLVALIVVSIPGYAQGGASPHADRVKPDDPQEQKGKPAKLRRLESVSWNPVTEELTWVISSGDRKTGGYEPGAGDTYKIRMDAAIMRFEGEGRRFSSEEAEQVHKLMDVISRYAIESTVWWEDGEGVRLDERGNPLPDKKQPKKITPGDLHAGSPGLLHASTAAPPPSAEEIATLRRRVAELEYRLSQMEQPRQGSRDDALSPAPLRQAAALMGQ